MKDLERDFFVYCCRKHSFVSYKGLFTLKYDNANKHARRSDIDIPNFDKLAETYAQENKCSMYRLWTYVEKWEDIGIINSGISTRTGWFEFFSMPMDYAEPYLYGANAFLQIQKNRQKSRPDNCYRNALIIELEKEIKTVKEINSIL